MFYKKKDHRKSGGGLGGIIRLFLSLIILVILGFGLYRAYKTFSGFDPLGVDPKSAAKSLVNPDKIYELVTGLLTISPSKSLDKAKEILSDNNSAQNISNSHVNTSENLKFKIGVVADSHIDTQGLAKALAQLKQANVKFVVGIGDFSDVGTVAELQNTKTEFDKSGLTYYVTPGDHDLWDSRNKNENPYQNFTDVFQTSTYKSFSFEDIRFIIVYNTDNYLGLDGVQLKWIDDEMQRLDTENPKLSFVFAGTPLFHPSSDHVMGKTNAKLKNQADHLASIFKKHGVAEVFAGDAHFFSRYKEPTDDLPMTSVGAVTSVRNPQAPRYSIIDIFDDGSYNVEDLEIK